MKYTQLLRSGSVLTILALAFAAIIFGSQVAQAASWKGLEPFVSKRADVERILGRPTSDRLAENGTLYFDLANGPVTVSFVTPKFIAAKKLSPALEGTILTIAVQHRSSTDTPESLNLVKNPDYERQASGPTQVYTNPKDGIYYTFVESRLKTTRYSYSEEQFASARKPQVTP